MKKHTVEQGELCVGTLAATDSHTAESSLCALFLAAIKLI
jgi:hypothetical protein